MITHRNVKLVTLLGLLTIISVHLLITPLSWWWYLLPALFYTGFASYGSSCVSSGFFIPVFTKGKTDKKHVALTFDDGPDPDITPQVLDILKENNIRASFFLIGSKAEEFPELVKRIVDEGHLIGNHTWSHSNFIDLFSSGRVEKELNDTGAALEKASGRKTRMFRPPYGVTNPMIAAAVKRTGLQVIGWSIRSLDTVIKSENKIIERIIKKLHPGGVILLHDRKQIVIPVLKMLLKELNYRKYSVVPLNKILAVD